MAVSELESEIESKQQELRDLQDELEEKESELEDLESDIDDKKDELADFKKDLAICKRDKRRYSTGNNERPSIPTLSKRERKGGTRVNSMTECITMNGGVTVVVLYFFSFMLKNG